MLDPFWITDIVPVTSTYEPPKVTPYIEGRMLVGHTAQMFLKKTAAPTAPPFSARPVRIYPAS